MTTGTPALGAEGWFTTDGGPALLGCRCTACGAVAFPPTAAFCPNPRCAGGELVEHRLASTGRVWSYTDARYQPPPPYVPATDPFEPFCIVAAELDRDGIVVLGQLAAGHTLADLHVGRRVELVVEPLFVADDATPQLVWKWKPC